MNKNFYNNNETSNFLDPPLIPDFIIKSNLSELTLPNGNQVLESIPLTSWFHTVRSDLIENLNYVNTELKTRKSTIVNEVNNIKKYLKTNVFTDPYEILQLPQTNILVLCAYFVGRIASNKNNWGLSKSISIGSPLASKPSTMSKVVTSIPSKILLPWILVGCVLNEMVPNSLRNAILCAEKDILSKNLVNQYRTAWDQYYVNGLKRSCDNFCKDFQTSLQAQIKSLRKLIINQI